MEIPERSYLYNIEPLGKGSPFVESLSSYIARLSSSHCVYTGTLITKIVIPVIQRRYLMNIAEKGGDGFSRHSNCVNGVGELANDFIRVMENLTKRNDLSDTTLFKFNYILPKLGLLKKKRAWCPLCFEKMNLLNEVYEPLIWNLSLVKICPEHNIFLVELCPKCESRLYLISRKSIPGYCSRCLCWLGEDKNIKPNENEHYVKQANFVKEVMRWSLEYKEIPYKKEDLACSINWIIKVVFDNNCTNAANQLGVSKSSLHCWSRGKTLPTFETITTLCLSFDLTIEEFYKLNKTPKRSLKFINH
ncbi:TniQ family protein [Peribacillus frigoritolerans]|uniref:TniQ family protein n=1 Tax=Peribacillus frigoritolerans TaxID=450367 RepID=UPI0034E0CAE9